MNELINAVLHMEESGHFSKENFEESCTVACNDSSCGYTVIGSILTFLFDIRYKERRGEYVKLKC